MNYEYLLCRAIDTLTPSKGDMIRSMAFLDNHSNMVHIEYEQMRIFQNLIILEDSVGNLTILNKHDILSIN